MNLKNLDYPKSCGFIRIGYCKQWWLFWPIIIIILLQGSNLFGDINIDKSDPIKILLFILFYLTTGFFEEALMRGVVLQALLKKWASSRKGIYFAVIISSLIFGLTHIVNYFMHRETLGGCLNQMIYATFIGVFFAACVLRTQSITMAMFFHGLFILGKIKPENIIEETFC